MTQELTPAKFACLMVSRRLTARPKGQKSRAKNHGVLMVVIERKAARRAWSRRARAIGAGARGTLLRRSSRGRCDQLLGRSTLSTTWITPFDWNTFWIVTLEA